MAKGIKKQQVIAIIRDGNGKCKVNPPTVEIVRGNEVNFKTVYDEVVVIMPDDKIFGGPSEFKVTKMASVVKVVPLSAPVYLATDPAEYAVVCRDESTLCRGHSHPRMIID